MNAKEAWEIIKASPMQGNISDQKAAQELYSLAYAKGYLECFEQMKPFVGTLGNISQSGCIYCESPEKAIRAMSYWRHFNGEESNADQR